MGLFDWIKRTASRVWDTARNVGGKILGGANRAREMVGRGWNAVKNVPIIGNIADRLAGTPIPFLKGVSIKDLARTASGGIDMINRVGRTLGIRPEGEPAVRSVGPVLRVKPSAPPAPAAAPAPSSDREAYPKSNVSSIADKIVKSKRTGIRIRRPPVAPRSLA